MFQKLSLRLKLSLSVALLSMVVLGIMTYLSAHQSFISAEDNARAISLNSARSYAGQVRSILEGPLTVARSIAQSLIGKKEFGEPSRDMISSELHRLLIDNKDLIGTWTGWEANALDGKDAQWVKKTGHDETGRVVAYWS